MAPKAIKARSHFVFTLIVIYIYITRVSIMNDLQLQRKYPLFLKLMLRFGICQIIDNALLNPAIEVDELIAAFKESAAFLSTDQLICLDL